MIKLANLKDIAVRIKRQKDTQGTGTVVFIGAGCSVSAGIPTCLEMLEVMEKDFNDLLADCQNKDYASYMNNLTPSERKIFLDNYIKNAKLNISHVFLASLVKNGYVDCIVTTNFDNLALKALTTLNEFPAVYDLASSSNYISGMLNFPAVVYLHGQHTGMWQMNTGDEMDSVKKSIAEAFNEILANRTLIVVGYGGNDPVLDVLASIPRFNHNAYWISYKDKGLPAKAQDIWSKDSKKNILHLPGYDSDKFFFDLHNELSIESPDLFTKPFQHLIETYELVSKDLKMDGEPYDLTGEARNKIIEAEKYLQNIANSTATENNDETLKARVIDSWLSWKKNDPDNIYDEVMKSSDNDVKIQLSKAYTLKGNSFVNQKDYNSARISYEKGISLNPNSDVAHMNLASSLAYIAELKSDEKAYTEVFSNYKKAEALNPGNNDIYNNWGSAILGLAEHSKDEKLYLEALEKYKKAIELNPKDISAHDNMVTALLKYASLFKGNKKTEILNEANQKALVNYKMYGRIYNLSCTYALLDDKINALKFLEESLKANQIKTDHVKKDNDWDRYRKDVEYNKIIEKYKSV
jgi:tetratricopeptide (TPR) repeat protein